MPDFKQLEWDRQLEEACQRIVKLALEEDLAGQQDLTTVALVPADRQGAANVVSREPGIVAGISSVQVVLDELEADLTATSTVADGDKIDAGTTLIRLEGNVRHLLTAERTLLNLLSRLMGIATLASRYVAEVAGTQARVYDTRKTTPGWRLLEKYAARCGGACNHRLGLYDAVLIKDNHLAQCGAAASDVAGAVEDARKLLEQSSKKGVLIEVEVDSLDQLAAVLPATPDIVLLDNMSLDILRAAVKIRNEKAPEIELEASGGVRLETSREIAKCLHN